ncbi:hypothetical protein RRF57_011421 [Xylaria bambusicola]|uniref:Uncharacterized protein n=1 Tax=Xylaria bambusicola TaxID=326684 RepID=A0AAN7UWR6_9PEZI
MAQNDSPTPSLFLCAALVEEAQYLSRDVFPSGGVVVHDTGGCGEDNVTELTSGQELRNPLFHL